MINTIIFDLGGVLIDWDPKYMYKNIFEDEAEMEHFLANVCTADWNEEQDAGRTLDEATNLLVNQHPDKEPHIRAFYDRWVEMLGGPIADTVQILWNLKQKGKYKLYALTNWSNETFPVALERYEFLSWFDGIVVSGAEKMRKPTAEFYHILLNRYNIKEGEALFIDDNLRNVKAAEQLGIQVIHFTSPGALQEALRSKQIV